MSSTGRDLGGVAPSTAHDEAVRQLALAMSVGRVDVWCPNCRQKVRPVVDRGMFPACPICHTRNLEPPAEMLERARARVAEPVYKKVLRLVGAVVLGLLFTVLILVVVSTVLPRLLP